MSRLQRFVLALVLVPVGFLAGTDVFEMMGNMPAVARMPLATHVASWQALDFFMEPRMPFFATSMFVLFLLAIACFWRERRRAIFPTLIVCSSWSLRRLSSRSHSRSRSTGPSPRSIQRISATPRPPKHCDRRPCGTFTY